VAQLISYSQRRGPMFVPGEILTLFQGLSGLCEFHRVVLTFISHWQRFTSSVVNLNWLAIWLDGACCTARHGGNVGNWNGWHNRQGIKYGSGNPRGSLPPL
jgi:hypothetical protein